MVSSNFVPLNIVKSNVKKGKGPRTSNLEHDGSNDASHTRGDEQQTLSLNQKIDNPAMVKPFTNNTQKITTNMNEKQIKIILFLLEGSKGFSQLTPREQMTETVTRGTAQIHEWFFEQGISDSLPTSWAEFKIKLINFCTENTIECLRKFSDEKWSQYIFRLNEWAISKNVSKQDLINKIKTENCSHDIKMILLTNQEDISELISRIKEYEEWTSKAKPKEKTQRERIGTENKIIRCYNCEVIGHKSFECPKPKKRENQKINAMSEENDIRREKAKLNDFEYFVLLDSGSSVNVIHKDILKKIKNVKLEKLKYQTNIKLINGTSLNIKEQAYLNVSIYNRSQLTMFNVYENGIKDVILGWNFLNAKNKNESIPIECNIETLENKKVNWTRPIKGLYQKIEFKKIVDELLKKDVIEQSYSTWLNPVVLAQKKNGAMRFCVDLRKLNDIVEAENYPLPRINDLIATLRGKTIFSLVDLKDGFFHINIRKADRFKTAFYCENKLYQFKKMPQGFKNSPSIFQQAMNYIFGELIGKSCLIYIDDILIFGENKSEHDENFEKVQSVIKKFGLNENLEKRIFAKEEVCFLGYIIGKNKIKPKEERAQGIVEFKRPLSKKEVQRFIGLVNYDRQFIKNLSEKTSCLAALIAKDRKFIWEEAHDKAFKGIKEEFKKNLEILIPDFNKEFTLETDASNVGLGAVLRQEGKPIAFASRKLSILELKYGITEKEALAALWGMEKFQFYLIGKSFCLITDHQAMVYMNTKSEFGSARIQRWFERFNRFQFTVKYRKGPELIQADALSRAPTVNTMVKSGEEIDKEVLSIHKKYNHRKNLSDKLKEEKINISKNRIKEILEKCKICAQRDNQFTKANKHIMTKEPGEMLGVDLMITSKKELIILAIDYYTRKLYGKVIKSKHAKNILSFLEQTYKEIKFKVIVSDNGREFDNIKLRKWCVEKEIELKPSIPYYHKSNGRIERAIRTIRMALNKTGKSARKSLEKIVENYNNMPHRAIGLTPNDAFKENNREIVLENEQKYAKEFKQGKVKEFKIGENVYIKNETKTHKDMPSYKDRGRIIDKIRNKYVIEKPNGKGITRHSSQLKICPEELVSKGEVGELMNSPEP